MHSTDNSNGIITRNAPLISGISSTPGEPEIVGESLKVREVLEQVEMVAPTDCAVLLQGETGTGKEVFAEVLHNRSLRRNRPLIKNKLRRYPERSPRERVVRARTRRFHRRFGPAPRTL